MAESEWMRRLREAGTDFTETARARAEELLGGLRAGSPGTNDPPAEPALEEHGKQSGDPFRGSDPFRAGGALLGVLRREIRSQLVELGLAGDDDLRQLRARVNALDARLSGLEAEVASARAAERPGRAGSGPAKKAAKAAGAKKATKAAGAAKKAAPRADRAPSEGPGSASEDPRTAPDGEA